MATEATAEILRSMSKDWGALSHTNGSSTDKHLGDPAFRPLSTQSKRMHMAGGGTTAYDITLTVFSLT